MMNAVLRQLHQWRFREQLIRLAWGGARTLAVVLVVLGAACALDWLIDRYSGSRTWRDVLSSSWVLAGVNPLGIGETPYWFRVLVTLAQLGLAGGLVYYLILRPWRQTPPIDDLATVAEQAFPEFDHRLVTAIQLNRPGADTRGMSPMLINEVTREAGQIAARHNLLQLIDYRRLRMAAAWLVPVVAAWLLFGLTNPSLAWVLVQRQALLDVEIPRRTHLHNLTPEVWPTGQPVLLQFRISGEYDPAESGVVRIVPDGQREYFKELTFERLIEGTDEAIYSVRLEPSSFDFSFQARLGDGRTREPGRVWFEAPPQLEEAEGLIAIQVLPTFLGTREDGLPYTRRSDGWQRGEVNEALPQSKVIVDARFNKPIRTARLIPIERQGAIEERDLPPVVPFEVAPDQRSASFGFDTTPRLIGYRLELEDHRGFRNPLPIRRAIRMYEDRPPTVVFRAESNRNPDPTAEDGQGNPRDYEWDAPLTLQGRIQVIYNAQSELGIREAYIRYRVIPKGIPADSYPEEYRRIQHPRDDRTDQVYFRLPLKPFPAQQAAKMGRFVPDLGMFEKSGVYGQVEFWAIPSRDPSSEPGELEAAGSKNFEVSDLKKRLPDGSLAKLELGDTVELYVEVFDKLPGPDGKPDPNRPAGYTREAKRKIVVSDADARAAIRLRDEAKQKLRDQLDKIAQNLAEVFKPEKK